MQLPNSLLSLRSRSEAETLDYGRQLANVLGSVRLVLLSGQLGAGKTVLVKGLAEGLGVASSDVVNSPSYTLVHEYRGQGRTLFHIDLYRIADLADLSTLGLEDILNSFAEPASVIAVEWGEKFNVFVPEERIEIRVEVSGEDERLITARRVCGGGTDDTRGAAHASN